MNTLGLGKIWRRLKMLFASKSKDTLSKIYAELVAESNTFIDGYRVKWQARRN